MLHFECDYNNGCCEEVLKALCDANSVRTPGYGCDEYSESAKAKIRLACGCPEADVFFLAGGTQTNLVVISSLLRDYEGVLAAETGHIGTHESGAVEYTGHKVLPLPQKEGKLSAADIETYVTDFYADGNCEHMVFPGMVYISYPTEYGALYSRDELTSISAVCRKHNLPLFIDGARLGYGLMSPESGMTLPELAGLCDVFYIGGTKVGALCGEAVVFPRKNAPAHFFSTVKQHGALLAKGRLCGVQFDALFTNGLYFKISRNAIVRAEELKKLLHEKGYRFFLETPTNQQFVIVPDEDLPALREKVSFGFWNRYDEKHTVIRFCTSWATTEDEIRQLKEVL